MNRPLPSEGDVRAALQAEIDESIALGRRPTVSRVERQLRVTHATFYRNYPQQIEWFQAQVAARRAPSAGQSTAKREDDLTRLRRENTDLRRQVRIYAESIRQLSLDKAALEDRADNLAGVTALEGHRRRRRASPSLIQD